MILKNVKFKIGEVGKLFFTINDTQYYWKAPFSFSHLNGSYVIICARDINYSQDNVLMLTLSSLKTGIYNKGVTVFFKEYPYSYLNIDGMITLEIESDSGDEISGSFYSKCSKYNYNSCESIPGPHTISGSFTVVKDNSENIKYGSLKNI